jgi:hypothetical protein
VCCCVGAAVNNSREIVVTQRCYFSWRKEGDYSNKPGDEFSSFTCAALDIVPDAELKTTFCLALDKGLSIDHEVLKL